MTNGAQHPKETQEKRKRKQPPKDKRSAAAKLLTSKVSQPRK